MPLALPKAQLPPTSSEHSKQSNGTPWSARTFAPAMPEEPAPMMQTVGSALMTVTGASRYCTHQALTPGAGGAERSSASQPTSRSRSASSALPPPRRPNSRLAKSR